MKKTTPECIKEYLLRKGINTVNEIDELEFQIENGNLECWEDEKCYIMVDSDDDKNYITITPKSGSLDIDNLMMFLNYIGKCESILINKSELTREFDAELFEKMQEKYTYCRTIEDYAYIQSSNKKRENFPDNIRLLGKKDKDVFVELTDEIIPNRPPLKNLFDVFVIKEQGEILSVFDRERTVGYLSFSKMIDNVFDVDFIYVIPEYRKKGYGKILAESYISTVMERGNIPYWSNAINEGSKRVALSTGFTRVREVYKFEG